LLSLSAILIFLTTTTTTTDPFPKGEASGSGKRTKAAQQPQKRNEIHFGLLLLLACEVASASRAIREEDGSDVRDPGLPA
jgi:hypothetical protein